MSKRASSKSAAQRTMEVLRKQGFKVALVEKWNAFAKVRQDLFGFIDVVAIREDHKGVIGVQCTTKHNMVEHLKKCIASPIMPIWLRSGNTFLIHGWFKSEDSEHWEYDLIELLLNEENNYTYNYNASGESEQYNLPISLEPLPEAQSGGSGSASNQ